MVASPLSLERGSAVPWRGSGRVASQGLSRNDSGGSSNQPLLGTSSPLPSNRCSQLLASEANGEGIGENTAYVVVRFSQRTPERRARKARDIIASTRRSERGPDGLPIGHSGG